MRVNGATGQTAAVSTTAGTAAEFDSKIKFLQQQKNDVGANMEKIKQSKVDQKTKQEQLKPLQEQLQAIDVQIQALIAEKARVEARKNEGESQKTSEEGSETNGSRQSGVVLELSTNLNQMKVMGKIKGGMNAEKRTLESEARMDRLHSNPISAAKKEEKAKTIDNRVAELTGEIVKKGQESQKTAEKERKRAELERENGVSDEDQKKREQGEHIDLQA